MANYFINSVAHAALPVRTPSTTYAVGAIRTNSIYSSDRLSSGGRVFRCTTAGATSGTATASMNWNTPWATVTDGSVVWTDISGLSAYNTSGDTITWDAPFYSIECGLTTPIVSVGDVFYISSNHYAKAYNHSISCSVSFGSGVGILPEKCVSFICIDVNSSLSSPTLAFTAMEETNAGESGWLQISQTSQRLYFSGLAFKAQGTNGFRLSNATVPIKFRKCKFIQSLTGSTVLGLGRISASALQKLGMEYEECEFTVQPTCLGIVATGLWTSFKNCKFFEDGVYPVSLFYHQGTSNLFANVKMENCSFNDFNGNILNTASSGEQAFLLEMENCLINEGLTTSTSPTYGGEYDTWSVTQYNCTKSTNKNQYLFENQSGSIKKVTNVYKTDGANDDGDFFSHLTSVSTHSSKEYPFEFDVGAIYNDGNTSITVEIHFTSATNLTDSELYFDVSYPSDASTGLYSKATTKNTNHLFATGSTYTTTSGLWTSGLTYQNKATLTFTPAKAGYVYVKGVLGKSSSCSVNIDPKIYVS